MAAQKFEVLLTGKVLPGFDRDQVLADLARTFSLPADKVAQLLAGKPRRIKTGVTSDNADKYLQHLRAIGAECLSRPETGSATRGSASTTPPAATTRPPKQDAPRLTQEGLRAAFAADIVSATTGKRYSLAMAGVALFVLLMPLVYLLLIAGVAIGTWWFGVSAFDWVAESPRLGRLIAYGCPIFAGVVLVFFMVKPVLHSIHPYARGTVIKLDKHPLLSTFIKEIVHKTGAPMPKEVRLDMEVNAYAAPLKGFRSLSRRELVLGIGMPLIAGCNTRQLAGIIGHELGHFAQQNGMQANYIIGSINDWFSRCVHLRDSWDERLDDWAERIEDSRIWFIMTARAGVWVGRRILSLFLILSAMVSRNLSRQMEFDADRYEVAIAGSETFAASARRLMELGIGQQLTIDDLNLSWQDGKLSEDMIPAIVDHSNKLPTDYQDYIRHALANRGTGIYDTHPSDGERIEAAMQQNQAGIFRLELPASVLIRDFPALCRQLTRDHYENEWQLQFSDGQLVSAEGVARQARQRSDEDASLESYLGSLFRPHRIIVPETPASFDAEAAHAQLTKIVTTLREKIPAYEQAMSKLDQVDERMADIFKGRMLIQNGIAINTAEFHLTESTVEAADAAWAKVRDEHTQARNQVRPIEQLVARRLGLEFSLILNRGDQALSQEYRKLVGTLTGLHRISDALHDFYIHAATLDQLVHSLSEGRDISDQVLDQNIGQCIDDYQHILKLLDDTPFPFERGDDITTVSAHLCECAGEPDAIRNQFARIWDCYCCVRDASTYLNRRIVARLATMAQALEDDLDVPHLKLTENPQRVSA